MIRNMTKYFIKVLVVALSSSPLFFSNIVHAGSFQLHEQNTSYLGNAYAGSASTCIDASTTYLNPAGLPELKSSQLVLSGVYYHGRIELYNASATNSQGQVSGSSTDHPRSNAVLPALVRL